MEHPRKRFGPQTTQRIREATALGIWGCLLLSIIVLGLGPSGKQTFLSDAIQSAGHFAFFGALGLMTAIAGPIIWPSLRRRRWLQYGLGLSAAILGGGLLELAQFFLPQRTPSWHDLTRDALGGVAASALLLIVEAPRSERIWSRIARWLAWPTFCLTVGLALLPSLLCGWDYWQRASSFPNIMPASQPWTQRFTWRDADVETRLVKARRDWPEPSTPYVVELELPASQKYPGFGMKEPYPDWRNYDWFVFEVWNHESNPVDVWLRIHDFEHNDDYQDRYHRQIHLEPGGQTCRISLRDVERSLRHRTFDLSSVEGFKLMAVRPTQNVHLAVAGFRLE